MSGDSQKPERAAESKEMIDLAARLTQWLVLMQPHPDQRNTPLYLTGKEAGTIVKALRARAAI